ncbi:MAG: hypothetical protein ACI4MF_01065 [Candidatus Faecivicinus sp.]
MGTPREILHQAGSRPLQPSPRPEPVPAPVQIAPQEQVWNAAAMPASVVAPRPIRQNSVYHQLMLRHDRVHTRHLQG